MFGRESARKELGSLIESQFRSTSFLTSFGFMASDWVWFVGFDVCSLTAVLDRASKSLPSPRSIPELYKKKEQNLKVFSFQELRDSTNGFSRLQELGEGGFGSVYKGIIKPKNGKGIPIWVAIKKLNPHSVQVRLHVWKRICSQRSRKLNPRPSPPESQFRSSFLTSFG